MGKMTASPSVTVEPFSLAGVPCMGEDGCGGAVVTKLHFGRITIVICAACRTRLLVGLGADELVAKKPKVGVE